MIHPIRAGRSLRQVGRKGLSHHRGIVGGTLGLLRNQSGVVVAWDCATATVPDKTFQWLMRQGEERLIVFSDTAFHAAEGDPAHLKLCPRGVWNDRMLEAALPLAADVPPEVADDLAAMHLFSDDALWSATAPSFSPAEACRLSQLNMAAGERALTPAEQAEQHSLITAYRRSVLRRAKALAILAQRGHHLPLTPETHVADYGGR